MPADETGKRRGTWWTFPVCIGASMALGGLIGAAIGALTYHSDPTSYMDLGRGVNTGLVAVVGVGLGALVGVFLGLLLRGQLARRRSHSSPRRER